LIESKNSEYILSMVQYLLMFLYTKAGQLFYCDLRSVFKKAQKSGEVVVPAGGETGGPRSLAEVYMIKPQ
jgi:hypothetical protein